MDLRAAAGRQVLNMVSTAGRLFENFFFAWGPFSFAALAFAQIF